MKITQNCLVELSYRILDPAGTLLESSETGEPLAYVHGEGELPPALEQLLNDKGVGDEVEQLFEPGECFPEFDPEMIISVPCSEFPEGTVLAADEQITIVVEDESGEAGELEARIIEVNPDAAVLDANHPMAGQAVIFCAKVLKVEPGEEA